MTPNIGDLVYGGNQGCEDGRVAQVISGKENGRYAVVVVNPLNPADAIEQVVIMPMTPIEVTDDLLGAVTFSWEYDFDAEWP